MGTVRGIMSAINQTTRVATLDRRDAERESVFDAFRRWGYLQADLDPLGLQLRPLRLPELDNLTGPAADEARRMYCGPIGAEFLHIADPEQRRWIEERLEGDAPAIDEQRVLDRLEIGRAHV